MNRNFNGAGAQTRRPVECLKSGSKDACRFTNAGEARANGQLWRGAGSRAHGAWWPKGRGSGEQILLAVTALRADGVAHRSWRTRVQDRQCDRRRGDLCVPRGAAIVAR